jgi:hypothetical protein
MQMKRIALLLLLALAGGLARPAGSSTPMPAPDPARLAAARRFVAALPIEEAVRGAPGGREHIRGVLAVGIDQEVRSQRRAADFEAIVYPFNAALFRRIDAMLPRLLPAVLDDMAVGYSFEMEASALDAAARFFATAEGRAFAARTVERDRLVIEVLQAHLFRAIEPDLGAILAEARVNDAEERRAFAIRDALRQRVNAASRRRD